MKRTIRTRPEILSVWESAIVTRPLTKSAIDGLHKAVDEQAVSETFKGYGPEQGYVFVREAVSDYYKRNGVSVDPDAVFISDGAKSDTEILQNCLQKEM